MASSLWPWHAPPSSSSFSLEEAASLQGCRGNSENYLCFPLQQEVHMLFCYVFYPALFSNLPHSFAVTDDRLFICKLNIYINQC